MLLRRALPEAKTPAPSCHLNFLTAPNITGVEQASRLLFTLQAGSRDGRPTSQTQLKLVPFGPVAFVPAGQGMRDKCSSTSAFNPGFSSTTFL
jgi:hypothetical protein